MNGPKAETLKSSNISLNSDGGVEVSARSTLPAPDTVSEQKKHLTVLPGNSGGRGIFPRVEVRF